MISLHLKKARFINCFYFTTISLVFLPFNLTREVHTFADLDSDFDLFPNHDILQDNPEAISNFAEEIVHGPGPDPEQQNSYALDPQSSVRLALAEQKIYTKLLVISLFDTRDVIPDEDVCYQKLKYYLADYEHDIHCLGGATGFKRAKQISENPLLLFRLVKRMFGILKMEVMNSCTGNTEAHNEILTTILNTLQRSDVSIPSNDDLDSALLGLIRIQYVYGLNATSELRKGILQGVPTNVSMTIEDCIIIALHCTRVRAFIMAHQWLTGARLNLDENLTQENRTTASRKIELSWKSYLKSSGYSSKEEADIWLMDQREENLEDLKFFQYDYYDTCRGKSNVSEEVKKTLKCYNGDEFIHPYWAIQPVKMEQLLFDPPLWLFHDFIRNNAINHIKSTANLRYVRSGVVGGQTISTHRTSMQFWLYDDEESNAGPVMTKLNRRIENLLNFKVLKKGSSHAMQVVEYSSLGGHYDFHTDSLAEPDGSRNSEIEKGGDRIATFFMFLNDVELGGYTAFPEMQTFVKPVKGSAILWRNMYFNGNPDHRTMHGGCPVIKGIKLAANKWIMQDENMLEFPCALDPTA